MLVWKSLSVRTAATISTPLFRAHAPTAVLHIKGLTAANVVFPPPEAIKEVAIYLASFFICVSRGVAADSCVFD
jgi:hypothetical protein